MSKDTGGPAFPVDSITERNEKGHFQGQEISSAGMTLRDYFAAKAMPIAMEEYRMVISRKDECLDIEWNKQYGLSSVAAKAYELADAMLEARK